MVIKPVAPSRFKCDHKKGARGDQKALKMRLYWFNFFNIHNDFCRKYIMNIDNSTGYLLNRTQEQATVRAQNMALEFAREQIDALMRIIESAEIIKDPNLGNYVDILA